MDLTTVQRYCAACDTNISQLFQLSSLFTSPDISLVVGGLRFYRDSSSYIFLSFFVSYAIRARWTELNHNRLHSWKWLRFKMYVRNLGYRFLYRSETQNHLFPRLRILTASLTAKTKHDVHNRASALQTTRGFLHCLETSWTLVHKRLKIGPEFLPTLRKFRILLHCHASQTVSKQNLTKLCDMFGSEPGLQMHVRNLKGSPQNCGAKTAYFVTVLISTKLCQHMEGVFTHLLPIFHKRSAWLRWH